MIPNLPPGPDSHSQLPVIPVFVILAMFSKFEPLLTHGNSTPERSLVDLSKSFEAFELSGGAGASSILVLAPGVLEGRPLAGGGARGRMQWTPELSHGRAPHPPTPSHLTPAFLLGCWLRQDKHTVMYQKGSRVSFLSSTTTAK